MACKNFLKKSSFHSLVDRMTKKPDLGGMGKSLLKKKIIRSSMIGVAEQRKQWGIILTI